MIEKKLLAFICGTGFIALIVSINATPKALSNPPKTNKFCKKNADIAHIFRNRIVRFKFSEAERKEQSKNPKQLIFVQRKFDDDWKIVGSFKACSHSKSINFTDTYPSKFKEDEYRLLFKKSSSESKTSDSVFASSGNNLRGGKVVFVSNRMTPLRPQLYLKEVDSTAAPIQLTNEYLVRDPIWSPNGKYVAYIEETYPFVCSTEPEGLLHIRDIETNQDVFLKFASSVGEGIKYLRHPDWSRDGKHIVMTFFEGWGARGLCKVTFNTAYQFNNHTTSIVVPLGTAPEAVDATNPVFSSDGSKIYFEGGTNFELNAMYSVSSIGGAISKLLVNGQPIYRTFAPSISRNGSRLIFNSEMWKDNAPGHIDEELMQVNFSTDQLSLLTSEPGNQYGSFAIGGNEYEYALQSSSTTNGPYDIFLEENGNRVKLDIADPNNSFSDYHPSWWKGIPTQHQSDPVADDVD